jgi:hypothetical protein
MGGGCFAFFNLIKAATESARTIIGSRLIMVNSGMVGVEVGVVGDWLVAEPFGGEVLGEGALGGADVAVGLGAVVGVWVGVVVGELVGTGVGLAVGAGVGGGVDVGLGVAVDLEVDVGFRVGVGEAVGLSVGVAVDVWLLPKSSV